MCHVVQVCVEGCYACESAVRGNLCLVKLLFVGCRVLGTDYMWVVWRGWMRGVCGVFNV